MSTPIIFKKYTKLQTPLATIISTDIKSIFPSHKCWLCLTTTKNESILLFFSSPRMMTLHYISICLSHCSIFSLQFLGSFFSFKLEAKTIWIGSIKIFFHSSLAMSVIKHFIWGEGGWILLLIYVLLFLWFYKMWERFIVWVARWIKLRHDEIKFFTNFKAFWSRNLTKKVFAYLKRALR